MLCRPLETEDFVIQSMPGASPTKWHIAHVSWFFETFALSRAKGGYRSPDANYNFLFNSYYNSVGPMHERPKRGVISRPTVVETLCYRGHVDEAMLDLIDTASADELRELAPFIELGLHHEQQHQELILTDMKHLLSLNPLRPVYAERDAQGDAASDASAQVAAEGDRWRGFEEGVREIGHSGDGFAYDNESPRHRCFLRAFELANCPATCAEYLAFIEDGGYRRPELWLSDGWAAAQREGWMAPLYWEKEGDEWRLFTLAGMRPIDPAEPVCHISLYEADAFARWSGARLPREQEWEVAASEAPVEGNLQESERFHPAPASGSASSAAPHALQLFGDVWEWTGSAYEAYPGYRPAEGALGEYNAKFMCSQMTLRGGSCATPRSHIRATYRNFFQPAARWQFSGVRLARDL